MPVDLTNRKLYIDSTNKLGITPQEVSLCLQDYRVDTNGNVDVGMMCSSPKLEEGKWSGHKPIRFNKWTKLTDDEFKGMSTDASQGIFYGIQFPAGTSAALNSSIFEIHSAKFTYLPPRGIAYNEPFRLDDFDGYHHYAEPNPVARFNKEEDGTLLGYRDDLKDENGKGGLQNIRVHYRDTNDTGVDLVAIYATLDNTEITDDMLSRTYPCILVSDADNTFNYFTALEYDDNGDVAPRPLKMNGEIAEADKWSVRFTKPLLSNNNVGDVQRSPFQTDMKGLKASIFLLESISTAGPLLSGNIQVGTNFGTHWIDVSDGLAASSRAIVVPDDNGVTLNLREYRLYRYFIPSKVSQGVSAFIVNMELRNESDETSVKSATLEVTLTTSNGNALTKTLTSSTSLLPSARFTWTELGGYVGNPGTTETVTVSVKTTIEGLSHTVTEQFNVAIS